MTTETSSATNGSTFRDELKHDAERLKSTIGERAKTEATTRIDQAEQAMGSASDALEAAAEKLERNPDAPDWMASAIQQAARKMDGLAGLINGRDLDDIAHEVTQFARHNPATFLAASAAAGFAAARVLRAGMDKKRHGSPDNASSDQASADHGYAASDGAEDSWSARQAGTAQHIAEGITS